MAVNGIVYLVALLLLLVNLGARGMGIQLSGEELDQNIKQYKLLQQSSIKTVKTPRGTIYDCMDFYKQPAFNHPLLKSHTFHPKMRPNYNNGSITNKPKMCRLEWLQGGGCPTGTVPIRRMSYDEYIQMKNITRNYVLTNKPNNNLHPQPGVQFAVLQTTSGTTKYYGVRGIFNYWKLSIGAPKYASGEMIVQNGNDMIIVGWTVNPAIYNDNNVHLFQYLNAGQTHCFNTACGFISISKDIPIDAELVGTSRRGLYAKETSLSVYQDVETKIWWLQGCGEILGFWPQTLFNEMTDGATYIAIGGEAYAPPGQPLPPMGSGWYPSQLIGDTAFWRNITVLDANNQHIVPQSTETYVTDSNYGVYEIGMQGNRGYTIGYGGTIM